MIDAESNSKWREVMKMSGEWPGFGGLPLPEMFDTIEALWKENADLKLKLELMTEDRERWADSACRLENALVAMREGKP